MGRGRSQGFLSKFFVSQCRKLSWGEHFGVSIISGTKTFRPTRRISRFSIGNFCLTVPKNIVGDHLCSTNFLVSKTFWDMRGERQFHDFLSEIFCHSVPIIFVGEPFSVSLVLGIQNLMLKWVIPRFSSESFFSHSGEKIPEAIFSCVNNIGY